MYNLIFLFLFIASFFNISRAYNDIDSLLVQLNSAEDRLKIEIFWEISSLYDHNNTDSSLYYALKGLEIAQNLKDPILLSQAYRIVGVSYDMSGVYFKALESYNLSMDYFKKSEEKDNLIELAHIIHDKGMIYQELREYDKAKNLMHNALGIYMDLNDSTELLTSNFAIGSLCWEIEEYDSALIYLETASQIAEIYYPEDFDLLCMINSEIIQSCYYISDLERAEKEFEKLNDEKRTSTYSLFSTAYMQFNKGLILALKENYAESLNQLSGVLNMSDSIGLSEEGINILIEMVDIAEKSEDFEKAFNYSEELLKREREWLDIQKVAYTKAREIEFETREKEDLILDQEAEITSKNLIILSQYFLFLFINFCIL